MGPSQECLQKVLQPIKDGLAVNSIGLRFKYPKMIRIQKYGGTPCNVPGQAIMYFAMMPDDIEYLDEQGNMAKPPQTISPPDALCNALANSHFLPLPYTDQQQ